MHHPSKHLVLKSEELQKIIEKTLLKQFPDQDELRDFFTFTLLKLLETGKLNNRLDVWLDDVINSYLMKQYEEESEEDASE